MSSLFSFKPKTKAARSISENTGTSSIRPTPISTKRCGGFPNSKEDPKDNETVDLEESEGDEEPSAVKQDIFNSESSCDSGLSLSSHITICTPDSEEIVLADDQDSLSDFSGKLTFAENLPSPIDSKEISYEAPCEASAAVMTYITFEVISAEIIKDGRSGHVDYTVLINPHKESAKISPTVIKRRYSDFENLHQSLKKKFPSIMLQISFPKKVLMGNFTSETIAKRSTAFEQYLTHLYSVFDVRYSSDFIYFFIHDDLQAAVNFFLEQKYSNAVPLLENVVPILEKLYGNFHVLVCQCLCCLVVCYDELDKITIAHKCAEVALKCCLPPSSAADDELRNAILFSAIRLCWKLGKDKRDLETKLEAMEDHESYWEKTKDLKEVLLKTFQLSLPR